MLTFDRVSFSYKKEQPVLTDLSFRLPAGGRLTVMGSSGCGKSTLLSLTAGRVIRDARRTTYVFQEPRLFPWLTVAENLAAALPSPDPKAIAETLCAVELAEAASLYPAELSGGMKSRVSLARGLLRGGDLFLLDEPFAALDPALRRRMTDLLSARLTGTGAAALLVTHQKEDARRFGGSLLTL